MKKVINKKDRLTELNVFLNDICEFIEADIEEYQEYTNDRKATMVLVASDGFSYRRVAGKKNLWRTSDGGELKGSMKRILVDYVVGQNRMLGHMRAGEWPMDVAHQYTCKGREYSKKEEMKRLASEIWY